MQSMMMVAVHCNTRLDVTAWTWLKKSFWKFFPHADFGSMGHFGKLTPSKVNLVTNFNILSLYLLYVRLNQDVALFWEL